MQLSSSKPKRKYLTVGLLALPLLATFVTLVWITQPLLVPVRDASAPTVSAVFVTDTAYLRNKAYHSRDDTPDTLNYTRMAMVVQGVFTAVEALAK